MNLGIPYIVLIIILCIFYYIHGGAKEWRVFYVPHGYQQVKYHQLGITVNLLGDEKGNGWYII